MITNRLEFHNKLRGFMAKAKKNMRYVATRSALDLHSEVVALTPLGPDEWDGKPRIPGTLKNSMRLALDKPEQKVRGNEQDPSGMQAVYAAQQTVKKYKLGQQIYIATNIYYAKDVEYGRYDFVNRVRSTSAGYSTQAPAGVFSVTAKMWQGIVKQAVSEVKV